MARCKNVSGPTASSGGSPGGAGGGDPPCRLSAAEKGKGKKLATKKRKANEERPRWLRQWQQLLRQQRGVAAQVH